MNKLWGDGKEGPVMVCVLEPGNIHKLMEERKPILIPLNDGPFAGRGLPAKLSVVIHYSETPIADMKHLERTFGIKPVDERTPTVKTKVPHCAECKSTVEELGVWRNDSPVWLVFCVGCGCVLGSMPPAVELRSK